MMTMYNDSLYRISLKCLIRNGANEVLVVKESGRDFWDFPGGGMEHGEGVRAAAARELKEEVGFEGTFTYTVIAMDEPFKLSSRDVWQIRIVLEVKTDSMSFCTGVDADEIQFVAPETFKESSLESERRIFEYSNLTA